MYGEGIKLDVRWLWLIKIHISCLSLAHGAHDSYTWVRDVKISIRILLRSLNPERGIGRLWQNYLLEPRLPN